MELHSQTSPRSEHPTVDNGLGNSEVILRLLSEIRDAQRESLEMTRESMLKQRRATRMAIPMMIFAFVIVAIMPAVTFYNLLSRSRTTARSLCGHRSLRHDKDARGLLFKVGCDRTADLRPAERGEKPLPRRR